MKRINVFIVVLWICISYNWVVGQPAWNCYNLPGGTSLETILNIMIAFTNT